jgi:hypothetical protein
MRPRWTRPNTRGQTLKKSTITRPPPSPIAVAHTITCATVVTWGIATSPAARISSDTAISLPSGTRVATQPPPKLPASAVSAVTTSVW